jgi:anti-anti-sigma factor
MAEVNKFPIAVLNEPAKIGDPQVIVLRGELDISTADAARAVLDSSLSNQPDRVVFEMAGLTFMDSSGIAVLVHAANRAKYVELRHPSAIIRRIIEITGLSRTFTIDA